MMQCHRSIGLSVRNCRMCRVDGGGWLRCPPGVNPVRLSAVEEPLHRVTYAVTMSGTGDVCQDCGAFAMIRTGTCLTCTACGSSSGGCS